MIDQQDKIIKFLEILFPDVKIYLFGSRARGTHSVRSDIDLALDWHQPIPAYSIIQANNIMEALNVPQKIDIVDLNSVSESLKSIILREGIQWNE